VERGAILFRGFDVPWPIAFLTRNWITCIEQLCARKSGKACTRQQIIHPPKAFHTTMRILISAIGR
jgi:hypothetical protein